MISYLDSFNIQFILHVNIKQIRTRSIYETLVNNVVKGLTYRNVRLRIALCLLLITGIRIHQLLLLKMNHVESIFNSDYREIDLLKYKLSSHNPYLLKVNRANFYVLKNTYAINSTICL